MTIEIYIPGNPVPQGRPKFARRGQHVTTYDPDKSRDWKNYVRLCAAEDVKEPFGKGVPLTISAQFHMVRPASISEKRRPFPTVKPDVDNLIKGVKDALTGICWIDDAQVVAVHASKHYSDKPGTYIRITEYKR